MSPRTISNSRRAIDTCTFQLHSWRPFHLVQKTTHETKIPDNNLNNNNNNTNSKPCSKPNKRACLSDRTSSFSIENLDMSRLSLFEEDGSAKSRRGRAHWMARKRRRRGSRSVSGRSCSVGGGGGGGGGVSNAYGTCSDFMMANNGGTDSSGELFVNSNSYHNSYNYNYGNDHNDNVDHNSDTSESRTILKSGNGNGNGEREGSNSSNVIGFNGMHCYHYNGNGNGNGHGLDSQGNESGYGSEPGYRGDAEFGYGDEFDEEEDDTRVLFWGNRFGDAEKMEIIGENTLQKAHHRCRRKKHELRMVDAV